MQIVDRGSARDRSHFFEAWRKCSCAELCRFMGTGLEQYHSFVAETQQQEVPHSKITTDAKKKGHATYKKELAGRKDPQ